MTSTDIQERIAAARREAETLKEKIRAKRDQLADTSCEFFFLLRTFHRTPRPLEDVGRRGAVGWRGRDTWRMPDGKWKFFVLLGGGGYRWGKVKWSRRLIIPLVTI